MSRSLKRRDFVKALGFGAMSLVSPGIVAAAKRSAARAITPKPNIVFILADDLGFKDVGYQGGRIKTPNIDKLAARGAKLDQFYVQPVCSPTRSSLMTGRYPMRYGLQVGVVRPWARHGLPLDERTLAQALKEAGYVTAIHGKWHLGHVNEKYLPTARGFDRQYGHYNGALDYFTHIRDGGLDWNRNDKPLREEGYTTDLLGKESARLIAGHDTSKPLFLYIPFNAVHSPFQAPQPYIDKYRKIKLNKRRIYAAMTTAMDDAIGQIVAALEKRRMTRNTLVIFCSDNGGVGGIADNGPLRGHKGQLYEGGIRVPAIAVWPGVLPAGAVVDEPLHIVDMYPTLIRLAGASAEQDLEIDGKDAWPTIAQGKPSPHEEILHNVTPATGAIRIGNWKLIWNGQISANYTGPTPQKDTYELFNIAQDPYEENNLIEEHPEKFKLLKHRLEHHAANAAKPNIPPNRMPPDFKTPKAWGHLD
jgi:arylsulfatase A-like enzyme